MSGHSKWTQIKRQKGAADIKRGQVFTKLASAITIAVKSGGSGDINTNMRLRLAVEQARSANMPKDNIERAIDRGLGKSPDGKNLEEAVYEGYGPAGVGLIIQAVTDNKQRTVAAVKNILDKSGGTLATPGSVSWQFTKQVLVTVRPKDLSIDDTQLALIDAGAQDMDIADDVILAYVNPDKFETFRQSVNRQDFEIVSMELTLRPTNTISIQDKASAEKVLNITEKLEEQDDVQEVYANFDIPETLLEEIASSKG